MSEIERRALMKGAALSALVFTAGGAKVLLSPRQALGAEYCVQNADAGAG